jgi:hypothetical protein
MAPAGRAATVTAMVATSDQPPAPAPADADEKTRWSRLKLDNIMQVASAAAGTAAIVYVVGGMVLWLRFHKAGLPPDQAVALMDRQQLLVIGLRLMVLPVTLTGALAWWITYRRSGAQADKSGPRKVFKVVLVAALVSFALMLPFSFASATWVIAAVLVVGYLHYEWRPPRQRDQAAGTAPTPPEGGAPGGPADEAVVPARHAAPRGESTALRDRARRGRVRLVAARTWARDRRDRMTSGLPLRRRTSGSPAPIRVTMLVVIVAALVSLGRQLDQPVQLLAATVAVDGSKKPQEGVYISSDATAVHLGVEQQIMAIRRSSIRSVTLGPPHELAPSPSIASRLLGGARFAITPFEWWCNGERYAWGEAGDLCQTQLQVHEPGATLAGDAVPVKLKCPAQAKRLCRGYVHLSSRRTYQLGVALPAPVRFPLRPDASANRPDAAIAPTKAAVVCVPVDAGQRGLLHNDPARDGRRMPFDLTISADAAGRNVLRTERFQLQVPRRGDPLEYWGTCSPLHARCTGTPGSRKRATVTCEVTARRRLTADVSIAIRRDGLEYASAAGLLDSPSSHLRKLTVSARVTRAIVPGTYDVSVVLKSGKTARWVKTPMLTVPEPRT